MTDEECGEQSDRTAWRCTKPGSHKGERHKSVMAGIGSYTWGYVPLDSEALPRGLCGNRDDHAPHRHDSETLGAFWCTADQDEREPGRSERARRGL